MTQTLEQQIREAFPDLPVPDSEVLVSPGEQDEAERRSIIHDLGGRRWSALEDKTLRFHHDALGFLTPVGFRYLLPAFMLVSLRTRSVVADIVVGALSEPSEPDDERWFRERMELMDEAQRDAIVRYLETIAAVHDWPDNAPRVALGFWKRFRQ